MVSKRPGGKIQDEQSSSDAEEHCLPSNCPYACNKRQSEQESYDRVDDEHPIQRKPLLREWRNDHRAERSDKIEENVNDDPYKRCRPQHAEALELPGAEEHECRDEREHWREEKRMGDSAMMDDVREAIGEELEHNIEIGKICAHDEKPKECSSFGCGCGWALQQCCGESAGQ